MHTAFLIILNVIVGLLVLLHQQFVGYIIKINKVNQRNMSISSSQGVTADPSVNTQLECHLKDFLKSSLNLIINIQLHQLWMFFTATTDHSRKGCYQ